MNDRELTELAAKAAGCYDLGEWDNKWNCLTNYEGWTFDPLTDDSDALRLAVKLGLVVCIMKDAGLTGVYIPAEHIGGKYDAGETYYLTDPYAATRRAIVRAAAEIGRTMKE